MDNPYAPPKSNVDKAVDADLEVPREILKKIRQAVIAAAISCAITTIFTLIAIAGTSVLGFTAWELVDVALIAGLAYGIHRKSRACAVLMFVYFVGAKIYMIMQGGKPTGMVVALIFLYYYALGVQGTFQYHAWVKQHS
jgi:serine/threonine-protein kinase